MAFRVQGKHIFLTYPRAERIASKGDLLLFLRDKVPTPIKWAIAEETHQDGGIHYHALLAYQSKVDIRDIHFYDYQGHHPNIQSARAPKQVLLYVVKEDRHPLVQGFDIVRDEDIYTVMKEEIGNRDHATEALEVILDRTGTKGLRLYTNIERFVDRVMKPNAVHQPMYSYPLDFPVSDVYLENKITKFILDVMDGVGPRGDRKSLWLYGESRLGKTCLARSLGTHWYMNGAWNVDCHDDRASYGVLDDIPWESLGRYYKGMLGLQQDVTVTDKYKKKAVIKHGRPVIILTNELPVFTVQENLWLQANVVFHLITERVY